MTWFREHCIICTRAFQSGKDILRPLARCHHSMWEASKTRTEEIVLRINNTKACLACGVQQAATHSCHALRQLAIVLIVCEQNTWSQDLAQEQVMSLEPPKPDPEHPLPSSLKRRKVGVTPTSVYDFQPSRSDL